MQTVDFDKHLSFFNIQFETLLELFQLCNYCVFSNEVLLLYTRLWIVVSGGIDDLFLAAVFLKNGLV